MKLSDLAEKNDISLQKLEEFVTNFSFCEVSRNFFGEIIIDNSDESKIIYDYRRFMDRESSSYKERVATNEKKAQEKQDKIQLAFSKMLITSGFNFDGYTIKKYSGYISGDSVMQVDRGKEGFFHSATNVGEELMGSLKDIRRDAFIDLKTQAYALGCNAIIGVDFDYLTMEPETVGLNGGTLYMPYVFGVTANGNAVIIEKEV